MKDVIFLGDSLQNIRSFPDEAKQDMGRQILLIQRGEESSNWKPMPSVGKGVREIRVRAAGGAYRTIYIAAMPEAVYVLHAFRKKTQKTRKQDIDLAAMRLKNLEREKK